MATPAVRASTRLGAVGTPNSRCSARPAAPEILATRLSSDRPRAWEWLRGGVRWRLVEAEEREQVRDFLRSELLLDFLGHQRYGVGSHLVDLIARDRFQAPALE